MSIGREKIDKVSHILRNFTFENQAEYQAIVGPLIAPLEIPKPLVVAPIVSLVYLGMDADNEEDGEENLIEHEAMIDPDWPPGNLTP